MNPINKLIDPIIVLAFSIGIYLVYDAVLALFINYPKIVGLCLPFLILVGSLLFVDKNTEIYKGMLWAWAFMVWIVWIVIKIGLYLCVNY